MRWRSGSAAAVVAATMLSSGCFFNPSFLQVDLPDANLDRRSAEDILYLAMDEADWSPGDVGIVEYEVSFDADGSLRTVEILLRSPATGGSPTYFDYRLIRAGGAGSESYELAWSKEKHVGSDPLDGPRVLGYTADVRDALDRVTIGDALEPELGTQPGSVDFFLGAGCRAEAGGMHPAYAVRTTGVDALDGVHQMLCGTGTAPDPVFFTTVHRPCAPGPECSSTTSSSFLVVYPVSESA